MLERKVLILKMFGDIYGFPARPVVIDDIAPLTHEARNNPEENRSLIAESLLPCTQHSKILHSFWSNVVSQDHGDSSERLTVGLYVEVDVDQLFGFTHP